MILRRRPERSAGSPPPAEAGAGSAASAEAGVREIALTGVSVGVIDDTPDGEAHRSILDGVDLRLSEPSVAVIGANGSGKSTLLQLLNGLVTASAGQVLIDGLDPARHPADVRARVGFVFTDPAAQLVMPTPL